MNPSLADSIRHDTIKSMQGSKSNEEFAQLIYSYAEKTPYTIIFFRTDPKSTGLAKHLTTEAKKLIDMLNRDIQAAKNNDEKLLIITKFIQSGLRLHFFSGSNHRVFIKDILNFLLLKYEIGICSLKNRRQFLFVGALEATKALRGNIHYVNSAEIPQVCEQLHTEIQQLITTQCANTPQYTLSSLLSEILDILNREEKMEIWEQRKTEEKKNTDMRNNIINDCKNHYSRPGFFKAFRKSKFLALLKDGKISDLNSVLEYVKTSPESRTALMFLNNYISVLPDGEYKTFLKVYKSDYNFGIFKSSKLINKLLNKEIVDMKGVHQYAADHKNSRTARLTKLSL